MVKDPAGKTHYFYGTEKGLFELEARRLVEAGSGDEIIQFADPRVVEKNGDFLTGFGQIRIKSPSGVPQIECGPHHRRSLDRPVPEERVNFLKSVFFEKRPQLQSLVHPIPAARRDIRQTEYFLRDGETYIYVDSPKHDSDGYYQRFRVFTGTPGNMKEETSVRAQRNRCGSQPNCLQSEIVWGVGGRLEKRESGFSWQSARVMNQRLEMKGRLESVTPSAAELRRLGIPGVPSQDVILRTPCDRHFATNQQSAPLTNPPKSDLLAPVNKDLGTGIDSSGRR